MRGVASPAGAYRPYASLMARLAALPEGGPGSARADEAHLDRRARAQLERRRVTARYFSYGFVTSLGLGCAAILPLVISHPGARAHRNADAVAGATIAEHASATLWPARAAVAAAAEIASFELPIPRSERGNTAFPVEITGAGTARESMTVVLRDMPEAAWLSKGQRHDATTWLLRPADLNNLRMSIYDGAPDAFDVTIEVATASGDPAARGVARVRVFDAPARSTSSLADVEMPSLQAPQQTADTAIAPRREEAPVKLRPLETAPQQKAPQKPQLVQAPRPVRVEELRVVPRTVRPEGMSSLGMATREPDQDDRQLWWRMPPSSWAGFVDLPGGN